MKRNRWKWIVASAGISLSLAAGSIHAQSDEGRPVLKWYQALTQQTKKGIADETEAQTAQAAERAENAAERSAAQAEAALGQAARAGGEKAGAGIRSAGEAYASELDAAADSAKAEMHDRLASYVVDETAEKSDQLEKLAADTISEMTGELDAKGYAASGN
ncbi:hypothetical protein [Cohnella hashimotonis]|uniref:Uncharacterized protein n=1 Tax=Cohnella hashimotonis TaxID=2826895 RepID=A0ABT6TSS2_9BACL|nr:hypothetical protein [Cohnella hashimotonis]MDI4649850.1 hypothetical protein [Cohnella hashimotonis]